MGKKTKKILSYTGVIIVLLVLAYPKIEPLLDAEGEAAGSSSNQEEEIVSVQVHIVEPDTIENIISTTGTLRANEEVELRSEVSGLIEEIYFKEGQPVEKGELLVKINDSELQAELTREQYRLDLAADRERRQKALLEKGGISQEEYDATLNQVNVFRSEVALIKAQIDKTEIRAPFDGKIGLKFVSDGSYLTPTTQIASLQNIDPIKIDFSIPERYAGKISEGDEITFNVQGFDRQFTGRVYAIEPRIDTETRTLQIRAKSDNPEGRLLPGAFADIKLTLDTIDDALMVPAISIVPQINGQKVYLVKNGRVQEQTVQTGLRTEINVQITEGVSAGDTVLTTGILQVRPGSEVKITNLDEL